MAENIKKTGNSPEKPGGKISALIGRRHKISRKRLFWTIGGILLIVALGIGALIADDIFTAYSEEEPAWVYIAPGSDKNQVRDSLRSALGDRFGDRVYRVWDGKTMAAAGAYRITKGDRAWRIARRISRGYQTPVKVTFNNVRTLEILADRLGAKMAFSPEEFLTACDSIAKAEKISANTFPTLIFPDTYEAMWTESPDKLLGRFHKAYKRFWTPERLHKAAALGLSPAQVYIVASIAEEESSNRAERGTIGRLYINRLRRGMPLQADPTVKFASGQLTARRITGDMLKTESPYNTYRRAGLPPGPIRIASAQTIDAILNSQPNNYIYMCAKPDFSGTHNFASDFQTHQRNAAAYHRALNQRGIH